jgi:hypothetical protein
MWLATKWGNGKIRNKGDRMAPKAKAAPKKRVAAAAAKKLAVQVRGRASSMLGLNTPVTAQMATDYAISNGLAKYHLEQDDHRVRMSEINSNGGTLFFVAEDASA